MQPRGQGGGKHARRQAGRHAGMAGRQAGRQAGSKQAFKQCATDDGADFTLRLCLGVLGSGAAVAGAML